MKRFCETHRLYYSGNECPMCRAERTERYAARYNTKPSKTEEEKKEVTMSDIERLKAKFNSK